MIFLNKGYFFKEGIVISSCKKECSGMKKPFIFVCLVLLFFASLLSGCTSSSQGIRVTKLETDPKNSMNMTEQRMEKFPHLKEAILIEEFVEMPVDEFYKLKGILEFFSINVISYQYEYYEITFYDDY